MVSVAFIAEDGPLKLWRWTKSQKKLGRQVALAVLEGVGEPSTDIEDDQVTQCYALRRQCNDAERRMVNEKFLQVG